MIQRSGVVSDNEPLLEDQERRFPARRSAGWAALNVGTLAAVALFAAGAVAAAARVAVLAAASRHRQAHVIASASTSGRSRPSYEQLLPKAPAVAERCCPDGQA
mmetsp:Transcript_4064/g.13094  ORF Transcript_4064/g.13094 Transcript_4064/m.13094 type:complete len:104 (+) Transcript_4064:3-314(+)